MLKPRVCKRCLGCGCEECSGMGVIYEKKWECSFCGNHEDQGMIHTTCIIPKEHFYFCSLCWNQWEGFQEITNINLLKLKARVRPVHNID